MKRFAIKILIITFFSTLLSCNKKSNVLKPEAEVNKTAEQILGNPDYQAISYGGYRKNTRDEQPTIAELKEDLKILHAAGIRMLRTYNVQLPHAKNVVKAIHELKQENPEFEMYVMLGAWIDCLNAWTEWPPDHNVESPQNAEEIARAVEVANQYPDIVKVIAVGNEAMVKWATAYYVQPWVILKWVKHLQELKQKGDLSKDLWITSSDNFASWGGGDAEYHVEDLNELIRSVDFISMHTYPMHDTHYNPQFWGISIEDSPKSSMVDVLDTVMNNSVDYAKSQYNAVKSYMENLGVNKPIHIGETGWASYSNEHYGDFGSKATDEYKEGLYYHKMRDWTNKEGISCFYFEGFDEIWKDSHNPEGSENHFGLFTIDGKAKYAMWKLVDEGAFKGLTRGGNPITKTYNGNLEELLEDVKLPPINEEIQVEFR